MRGAQTTAAVVAASYRAVAVASLAPYLLSITAYTLSLKSEMAKQDQGLHNDRVTAQKASQPISHLMVEYLLVEHESKKM